MKELLMLKHFLQTLHDLGRTDEERASRLGVSIRSITRYKRYAADNLPEPIEPLMQAPELLEALAKDARAQTEQPA